ncbi:2,3-bisphosphoglycerate-independent phosphoglycerate mutase, partial [Candidatus Berkelbacteria bacterium]|nr:2,3-bisphosphoglycerate-independent phosphoglycerate mutase [Candidatus Berkelbacteria bacterium]
MSAPSSSLLLIILDGWGSAPPWGGNAIAQAKLPVFDLLERAPHAVLDAAGPAVGLRPHALGNSEVGHLHLGAGRIVRQNATLIDEAIATNQLATNRHLRRLFEFVQTQKGTLHLVGLLSRATVHADVLHIFALLDQAKQAHLPAIQLHVFTDGRDSDPQAGLGCIIDLEHHLQAYPSASIRTIAGRYYGMDRDRHWERTERAYRAIVEGVGRTAPTAREAISLAYRTGETDEFISPSVIGDLDRQSLSAMQSGDGLLFWNFRADRMRQLVTSCADPQFHEFSRQTPALHSMMIASLADYGTGLEGTVVTPIIDPEPVDFPLARILADRGPQFHIAETEKYAHVTYFLNGGQEAPFAGEERVMVPSPNVRTYDLAPAMSARQIRNRLIEAIRSHRYRFLVANFANADMVGHTGSFRATVAALEAIDHELTEILRETRRQHLPVLITADHGNAEEMVNPETGTIDTIHTTNPVPCY